MSKTSFEDAKTQFDALVSVLAEDSYIAHVVSCLEGDVDIEHPVKNWKREMVGHLLEKYDTSLNIAHAAIGRCRTDYRNSGEARTHANEA